MQNINITRFRFLSSALFLILTGLLVLSCEKKLPEILPKAVEDSVLSGVEDSVLSAVEDSVLSSDGVSIKYQVLGDGLPALVFVHGWSCDHTCWKNQVTYFSSKYRVVTVDLAGHGGSGLTRTDYTMAAYGEDVVAVIRKLDLNKIILIGHSMGGAVIIETARRIPDRILCLVGVDTFQDIEVTYSDEEIEQFLAPFRENFKEMTCEFVMNMFPLSADSALVMDIVNKTSAAPQHIAISSLSQLFSYNVLAALTELRIPLQVISCDKYPVNVEAGKRHLSSFEVTVIPEVGHFLMLEAPESFNHILEGIVVKYSGETS